ncbi:serine-rich adhesin for platelets-like [Branchiostoma lanceolatum]|uniref:serine-rich adhesin for platelets-like n=1 Tax=Branchiostoma lanceolatum TaxID=7740 RepID=UPI0034573652
MDGHHGGTLLKTPQLPGILQQQLNQQRNAGRFCDVKLKLPGFELNAHYCVLAALSPSISAQGQSSSSAELCLPPLLTPRGVEPLLEWMYTSELTLSQENLLDVSFAAGYFQVEAVAKLCQTFQQNLHHGVGTSHADTGIQGEYARSSEEQQSQDHAVGEDRNVVETAKSSESQTDVQTLAVVRVKTEPVSPDPWGSVAGNIQLSSARDHDSNSGSMTSPHLPSNASPSVALTDSSTPLRCDTPATPAYLSSAADSIGHLAHHSGDLGLPESGDTEISSPTTGPRNDAGYMYADNPAWKDQDVNLVSSTGECAALSVSPHGDTSDNETPSLTTFDNISAAANPSPPSDSSHQIKIVAVVGSCRKLFYGKDFSVQTDQSGLSVQNGQSGLSVQTDQSGLVDTTCYGTPSGSSESAIEAMEVTEDVPNTTFQTPSSATSAEDLQQLPSKNIDEEENEAQVIYLIAEEEKNNEGEQNQASPLKQGRQNVGVAKLGRIQATSTTNTDTSKDSNGRDLNGGDSLSGGPGGQPGVSPSSRSGGFTIENREQNEQQQQRDYFEEDKRASSENVDTEPPSPKAETVLAKSATSDPHGCTVGIEDAPIHDVAASQTTSLQGETEESSGIEVTFAKEGDKEVASSVFKRTGIVYKTNPNMFQRETVSDEPDDRESSPRLIDLASTDTADTEDEVGPEAKNKQRDKKKRKSDKKKRKADDKHASSSETASPSKKKQRDVATRTSELSEDTNSSPPPNSSKKRSRRRSEDKQKGSTSKKSSAVAKMRSSSTDSSLQGCSSSNRKISNSRSEDIANIRRQLCHQPVSPPEKLLNCYFCDEQFSSEDLRVQHLQVKHPGDIPYRCGFCSKGFLHQRELSFHITTHKGTSYALRAAIPRP